MQRSQLAYISFDIVPAPKGAAVHIAAFTQALGVAFGGVGDGGSNDGGCGWAGALASDKAIGVACCG